MVTRSTIVGTPSVRKELSSMTIKELYDEVKYLVQSGYGDYEVEIAKDVNDDDPTPMEEGYFEKGFTRGNKIQFFGEIQ